MPSWIPLAAAVSVLFGAHNLFVKRAAGRVPDAWGALLLEATATLTIVVVVAVMTVSGSGPAAPRDTGGALLAAAGGLFVGLGSILYFWVFRLGAPLSVAVPGVLIGWVVVAAVLGMAFENEALGARRLLGLASAGVAIWLLRDAP